MFILPINIHSIQSDDIVWQAEWLTKLMDIHGNDKNVWHVYVLKYLIFLWNKTFFNVIWKVENLNVLASKLYNTLNTKPYAINIKVLGRIRPRRSPCRCKRQRTWLYQWLCLMSASQLDGLWVWWLGMLYLNREEGYSHLDLPDLHPSFLGKVGPKQRIPEF